MVTSKNTERKGNKFCLFLFTASIGTEYDIIPKVCVYICIYICLKQLIITLSDLLRSSNSSVRSCNNFDPGISKFSEGTLLTFPMGSYLPSAQFCRAVSNSDIIHTSSSFRSHRLTGFTSSSYPCIVFFSSSFGIQLHGQTPIHLSPFFLSLSISLSLCFSLSLFFHVSPVCFIRVTSENISSSVFLPIP